MRRLLLPLFDELVASVILYRFLWNRGRPPVRGPCGPGRRPLASADLATFYGPTPSPVDWSSTRLRSGATEYHEVFDAVFASPVRTAFPANDQVWLRHWRCRQGIQPADGMPARRVAVLGLDGLVQLGSFWFERLAAMLGPHAIDVVMMDEPFNFRRTPRGYQPGQLILGGDLWHQLAVLRQGVRDAWRLTRSLQEQGYDVGVVGVSFGGLLALLLALVEPRLRFVIALVPPADPLGLLRHSGAIVRAMRRGLGLSRSRLRQLLHLVRPVRPILWQPKVHGARIHLHAARYDRVVPPAAIERLATQWQAHFSLHDDNHARVFLDERYARMVVDHICHWTTQEVVGRYLQPSTSVDGSARSRVRAAALEPQTADG